MKISACSIVKNEAGNIKRSIESYRDAVDEIIIVDTGSTDDTVEICKSLGAKVLTFEWCNDFAVAKNYALEHAKGDWIIFLDADEWFVPKLKRAFFKSVLMKVDKNEDVIVTTMCDYDIVDEKIRHRGNVTRIFRNSPDIRYIGSIHEDIFNSRKNMLLHKRTDIEIFHSGYADSLIEIKSKRNLDILYKLYSEGTNVSTELYFYLFRENSNIGNIDEAIKFYKLFISQKDVEQVIKLRTNMINSYEIMYVMMARNRDKFFQQEIDSLLETAYNTYPELPVHSYMLGVEKLRGCDYQASYDWLLNAIELNKNYSEPYVNKFIGALGDAYYKLGYIRQKQERPEDALIHYLELIKIANPWELEMALDQIINIVEKQPEEEIILFINSIIDISKKENIECILRVLKKTKLHKAFVYYALKYNKEFDGQNETTYIAMILSGQAEVVVETAIEALKNQMVDPEAYKWNLDYAVAAIIYSRNIDLYNKNKIYIKPSQKVVIEAYLNNTDITESDCNTEKDFGRINDIVYFLLREDEFDKYKKVFSKTIKESI